MYFYLDIKNNGRNFYMAENSQKYSMAKNLCEKIYARQQTMQCSSLLELRICYHKLNSITQK